MLRSSSSKCVTNAIWETLSRARYAIDEKLAWEGEVDSNEDDFFLESPQKEDPNYNIISNTQAHLEVNGAMHAYIVKQLKISRLFILWGLLH